MKHCVTDLPPVPISYIWMFHISFISSVSIISLFRKVLCVWRENAVSLTEVRAMERQAQNHFQHLLQLKVIKQSGALICKNIIVIPLWESLLIGHCFLCNKSVKAFLAWRKLTQHAVSKRHQEREAVSQAQRSINQGKNTTPYNEYMQYLVFQVHFNIYFLFCSYVSVTSLQSI